MLKRGFLYLFCIALQFALLNAQTANLDSLKIEFQKAKHDTVRCNILNELILADTNPDAWYQYNEQLLQLSEKAANASKNPTEKRKYLKHLSTALNNKSFLSDEQGNIDEALLYRNKSLKISEEINDKEGIANSLNHFGIINEHAGKVDKALEYYHRAMKIREEINDKKGLATGYQNAGGLYESQGDIQKGLEYYHKALKLQEEIKDKEGLALTFNNLGYIYINQEEYDKSMEYYQLGLKYYKEIKDKSGIAFSLSNIGNLHMTLGKYDEALNCFNESIKLCEEIDYQEGIAAGLNSLASIYSKRQDYSKALDYNQRALKIFEAINLQYGLSNTLKDIGGLLFKQGKYAEAIKYANGSLRVAQEVGYPSLIQKSASLLKSIYEKQNNYQKAFEMYKLEIQMRDSTTNEETKKAALKKQFQYQYEKKVAADSVKVVEEKKVVAAKFEQEKTQRFALYGGLGLVLVFSGFMVNRYRVTHKQKQIIELKEQEAQRQNVVIAQQKYLVEEKHKEITDSINYAERIQRSFLATKEQLDSNLKEYFVFFQPKDVVSGDFYWAHSLNNGNFALVTADSTGHGVPGAIMSLLNTSSLEKAVESGLTDPAHILNYTREIIIERLKKDGSEDGGKDGMDCSLIIFDKEHENLSYAAAHNPVWVVRTNELIELKGDKMPVGKHDKDQQPFTHHKFNLQKNDVVYTLTDGFPDQFGGDKGKKFMYKQLKEVLLSISDKPMPEQKEILQKMLDDWKGGIEQVDDITIIGIRV